MKKALLLLYFCVVYTISFAQIQTPNRFLGYELGTRFTPHHQVVNYFNNVAANANNVKLQSYGKTYEGRPLLLAFISDPSNMSRLEEIRKNNLAIASGNKTIDLKKQPVIVWLSYGVHGNEANSTETAMKVLHTLVEPKDFNVKEWLKNTVVIIDPCLNPDGRDRYVNFFNATVGKIPNPDPLAREHQEPWPGGRANHYYFDLNRDWAWQTQIETKQRLVQYHEWLPQIHVDFHEQSYNEPYYFAPAAEPVHESVTAWQREFQVMVGKNNAKYFDAQGWQYFTKERFDILYPSYGDTYPSYNGAVGMTYEQGGIRAGLSIVLADGDTLTLKDRIAHHFTTSMSTLETAANNSEKLLVEFRKFFAESMTPTGPYKAYVVKGEHMGRIKALAELLRKNKISYAFGGDKTLKGYSYESKKVEQFKIERNDLVVNLAQRHGVMANILFEPQTFVSDSNTYDITAWALPYTYGLKAYALKEAFSGSYELLDEPKDPDAAAGKPYAWVLPWGDVLAAKTLIALQQRGVKVRVAEEEFTANGKTYLSGTLLIYSLDNSKRIANFSELMESLSKQHKVNFNVLTSGYVEKGKDLGSNVYRLLSPPKVAVLSGPQVSSLALGEVWHFFEQELSYPITLINATSIGQLTIQNINTLIIPNGDYTDKLAEQLLPWVTAGGKLILLEDAITAFIGKKPFEIKKKEINKPIVKPDLAVDLAQKTAEDYSTSITGAIYKVYLNNRHSLTYGLGKHYYTLKTNTDVFAPLEKGSNIGYLKQDSYTAGLVGAKAKQELATGMLYGSQEIGKGQVYYISTNVLFRMFWEPGKQVIINGVFL